MAGAGKKVIGGRFAVEGTLGRGNYGVVHRARDLTSGREVALKLLREAQPDARRLERFRREAELVRGLVHPGIVQLVDAGELEDGAPFIAYELIPGAHTFHEVLPRAALRRNLELLRDVARAVGAAHAKGVVHRDLKPENVLVDLAGQAHVADFGLAAAEGLAPLTRTGVVVGTPEAMAPEQVRGGPIGPTADVWALGVILYRILAGVGPFKGSDWQELAEKILAARPVPPSTFAPDTPPYLEALCLECLAPLPEGRPRDGAVVAARLDSWLRGVTAETETASAMDLPPLPPEPPRPRWPAVLAGLAAVAVVSALVLLGRAAPTPPARAGGRDPGPTPGSEPAAAPTPAAVPSARATSPPGPELPADPELLRERALAGDAAAMLAFAAALDAGKAGPPAQEAATEWVRRAAEAGHPAAMARLAERFRAGKGVAQDPTLARTWFERAARAGDPVGALEVGRLHEEEGRSADAVGWYRKSAAAGHPRGKTALGVMLEHGKGTAKDEAGAVAIYREAVDAGHTGAMVWLGCMLQEGRGAPRDLEAAAALFRRAAEAGDDRGMNNLGACYGLGRGVPIDQEQAALWYRRAAVEGNQLAMRNLASRLENGDGVKKDLAEAASWLKKAAEKGDVPALARLGRLLLTGAGGPPDPELGEKLLRRAAQANDRDGMLELGRHLRPTRPDEARQWLEKAAAAGSPEAAAELAASDPR